ncbi:unnamed protein product [Caenorhabditis bovis]|uniref:DM domain-containing protein n=1 Tax=Caenorhabditis bovis TaxID=2654633 RepID=A0A8S1EAK2_9PELO|nr:unnamed protein product [Caenorhabditis bovis]
MAEVMCARALPPMQIPVYQVIPNIFLTKQRAGVVEQKKVYYCQRCLNHNKTEPRKNHKCECPFANCTCFKCSLVEKRRKLNLQLHELEGDVGEKKYEDDEDRKLKGGESI